jgi:hypothetical protein
MTSEKSLKPCKTKVIGAVTVANLSVASASLQFV